MKNTTFVFSLLSILIPLPAYAFFFLAGLAPARLSEVGVYVPLLVSNAVGIVLSVITLAKSNPTDISPGMRIAVLLATIGMFANTIAVEVVHYTSVVHTTPVP